MQSCSIYKASTLDLGVEKGEPVKLTYMGQPMKFEKVISKDGNYYGVKKIKGELTEMILNEEYSQKVKVKEFSTILTIVTPILITGAAIGIIASSWDSVKLFEAN